MKRWILILLVFVVPVSCFHLACTNQQIDGWQKGTKMVARATTQPFVNTAEDLPIIGDWIKAGAGILAAFVMIFDPFLDFLRPPIAAVPRPATSPSL